MGTDKKITYDDLFEQVRKPSRYIGHEWNIPGLHDKTAAVSIALAFPDTYELGMSHLGLKILYALLNEHDDIRAERVFAPARDFSDLLRQYNIALSSLETKTPLHSFDLIGFSLQYELGYTNLLNMLELGGIPLRGKDRAEHHPIIIAGGPCAFNPEPLAPFIDAFLIGDGEQASVEICRVVKTARQQHASRKEILRSLSHIEGVYVPSLYTVRTSSRHGLQIVEPSGSAPFPVHRRIEFDLDNFPQPDYYPVPYCEAVHDRINIEISRGCNAGCRFCQAGVIYRPNRARNPNKLIDTIKKNLASSGFDEVSLASLDVSSYPCLDSFIGHLMQLFTRDRISLSLPSVRTKAISQNIAKAIQTVRKTGFTLAPEAGAQRMRDVINKGVTEDDIFNAARFAFSQGWQLIKLYFMIGLPTETADDIDAIFELSARISAIGKEYSSRSGFINLSASTFVPKPHTPFQWYPMIRVEEIKEKQNRLLDMCKRHRSIKFKWHQPQASFLEAIISRGDRAVADLIETAYRNGALFDAWTDELRFDLWESAFEKSGIDPERYLYQEFPVDEPLPWSHIHTGVDPAHLLSELKKSTHAELTPPCSPHEQDKHCHGCRVCSPAHFQHRTEELCPSPVPEEKTVLHTDTFFTYKSYFRKTGEFRFLSHKEIRNALHHAFKRANIPVRHSFGHNPHPKFSYGPALPVGMAAFHEPFRVELMENIPPEQLQETINAQLPESLALESTDYVKDTDVSLKDECRYACYSVGHRLDRVQRQEVAQLFLNALQQEEIIVEAEGKDGTINQRNLRPAIRSLSVDDTKFVLDIHFETRPVLVLDALVPGKYHGPLCRERFTGDTEL
ncbi:MAG: TIGR03960 family B12-binding radical SAM protein [Candidatus Auribacterota bacterium]